MGPIWRGNILGLVKPERKENARSVKDAVVEEGTIAKKWRRM